jgi:small subunit ribosomal protein S21
MNYRPVEVEVRDSLEKAMKVLKQRMSKEGILQELKRRRFYEKPSVKRKRKIREAAKRRRKERRRKPT